MNLKKLIYQIPLLILNCYFDIIVLIGYNLKTKNREKDVFYILFAVGTLIISSLN